MVSTAEDGDISGGNFDQVPFDGAESQTMLNTMSARVFRILVIGAFLLMLVGVYVAAQPILRAWLRPGLNTQDANRTDNPRLESDNALTLTAKLVESLGVRTAVVAAPRPIPALSNLPGTLAIDTDRLARVHSRFAGEVHAVGMIRVKELDDHGAEREVVRPIRFGDHVEKGQLLAVIWSKDLGEKKSELVEAVSRLRLDQTTAKRMEELYRKGATPERTLREAERAVEAGLIAVARLERTLRSWRLSREEIDKIKAEADVLTPEKKPWTEEQDLDWAKADVRAPFEGTILERNVAVGDIVETTTDLFKIADLRRLAVWVYASEEELPTLQRLLAQYKPLTWEIKLKSDPEAKPIDGIVQQIGDIIDPSQRTALVTGMIPNSDGSLRVGQFITARILLPPAPGELEIPAAAVLDDRGSTFVFLQPTEAPVYRLVQVQVVRRLRTLVIIKQGEGAEALRSGDRLVVSGGNELLTTLRVLQGK